MTAPEIHILYESRFGLARGAVLKAGKPFIYLEGLEHDPSLDRLGVRSRARLKSRAGGIGFLELADGGEAILDVPQDVLAKRADGAVIDVEIAAEARDGKLARARLIADGEGALCRLSEPLSLYDRLLAQAQKLGPDINRLNDPDAVPDLLDEAEAEALSPSGAMAGGGYLSIERTRALIACDVDAGGHEGVATPRAFAKACNERAMAEVARRLTLSGLGGLVVVDLIGKRHDGARLLGLLRVGFGPEADAIIPGPLGKFGTLEFVRPWQATPLMDTQGSPLRTTHVLLREAVRRAEPGRLMVLRAPPQTLDRLRDILAGCQDPLAAVIRLERGATPEVDLL